MPCSYFYSAQTGFDFFYSVTDEWGNKWAMQTSQLNLTTEEDWDAMVDEVGRRQGPGCSRLCVRQHPLRCGSGSACACVRQRLCS